MPTYSGRITVGNDTHCVPPHWGAAVNKEMTLFNRFAFLIAVVYLAILVCGVQCLSMMQYQFDGIENKS